MCAFFGSKFLMASLIQCALSVIKAALLLAGSFLDLGDVRVLTRLSVEAKSAVTLLPFWLPPPLLLQLLTSDTLRCWGRGELSGVASISLNAETSINIIIIII